ncbi:MAG: 2-oxo acid dehydrogenase subunit E2 [Actinobacteria bacterium]|nr:2-oxo acid dehydrogenase subunit E2 [Actinomycetota bacterium]
MDVVTMPQLGETVTEGTITTWSKAVGDAVQVDDALFEVSTEKVDTEVPSAFVGVLRAILVEEGDTVAVGVPVAVITATADEPIDLGDVAAPPPEVAPPEAPTVDDASPPPVGRPPTSPAPVVGAADAILTPVVRRLLAEHGLDPTAVVGTGRDGRITRADVLAAAAAGAAGGPAPSARMAPAVPLPSRPGDEVIAFGRARAATAGHMRQSLDTAAHALVVVPVDYAAVDPVRRAAGLSFLPFVARAVVDAIREFPHVNASTDGERLVVHRDIDLGIAVDVDHEALVVPMLAGAQDLRLTAIAEGITDLADRARRRRLDPASLEGGTFTLTNVGSFGTVIAAPIIRAPQVAILSTDGVRRAPVAVPVDPASGGDEWAVAVHPVGNLSLSFDHRAIDGAYAAAFLARVRSILEERDWSSEVGS